MPRVSIVIPTRNRAHFLKVAIESALGQTWRDLEILVSDNYCGKEDTRDVYLAFKDPRLRYVRTAGLLAMPDSWEFALSHATGEYVTILSDDSSLLFYAIEKAMEAGELPQSSSPALPVNDNVDPDAGLVGNLEQP